MVFQLVGVKIRLCSRRRICRKIKELRFCNTVVLGGGVFPENTRADAV